ncbi:hypothetical protein DAMA08_025980 [Martiniozyma asiatica (nom. inval.)]|nr:hypothetical protein DAMA08_025980 [Martiniozyma asiatica]
MPTGSFLPSMRILVVDRHVLFDSGGRHSRQELRTLMLGGVGVQDSGVGVKCHALPSLSQLTHSVLVTRLFSVDRCYQFKNEELGSGEWCPEPFYPEMVPQGEKTRRLAIGVVLPVPIESLPKFWDEVSKILLKLQDTVIKKLKNLSMLHSDPDLMHHLLELSQLVQALQMPRLFYDTRSTHILHEWTNTLSEWLRVKDPHFLAEILHVLMPLRSQIFEGSVKVVISTGNPVVSEKLIFLLATVLGWENYANLANEYTKLLNRDAASNISDDNQLLHKQDFKDTEPIPIRPFIGRLGSTSSISMSPASRGWSPSVTESYKSMGLASISKSTVSVSPATTASVSHSASIPIQRGAAPHQSVRRSSSYASLQSISTSYGTSISGFSGSFLGSWMDRFRTTRQRMVVPPAGARIETDHVRDSTPSPRLGPVVSRESDLDNFDYDQWGTPSSPKLYEKTFHGPKHEKFESKNKIINRDFFRVSRDSTSLKIVSRESFQNEVGEIVQSIMSSEINGETRGDIYNIPEIPRRMQITTEIELPLLVGYVPEYNPIYHLSSCPPHSFDEKSNIKERIFVINIGTRTVCELGKEKPSFPRTSGMVGSGLSNLYSTQREVMKVENNS